MEHFGMPWACREDGMFGFEVWPRAPSTNRESSSRFLKRTFLSRVGLSGDCHSIAGEECTEAGIQGGDKLRNTGSSNVHISSTRFARRHVLLRLAAIVSPG
jgi:hypothetical protein